MSPIKSFYVMTCSGCDYYLDTEIVFEDSPTERIELGDIKRLARMHRQVFRHPHRVKVQRVLLPSIAVKKVTDYVMLIIDEHGERQPPIFPQIDSGFVEKLWAQRVGGKR